MSETTVSENPVYPTKLEEIDRLKIENLFLQVQNLALQGERLQADLLKSTQMRIEAQRKMSELQAELGKKYNCDLTKVKILPDGTIVSGGN